MTHAKGNGFYLASVVLLTAVYSLAQTPPAAAPLPLKKLSLEELSTIDVVSVGKKDDKILTAAASLGVITQEDIRRSGVRSIPEALRLATGLEVAIFNNGTWTVSARGFSTTSANKMQVFLDGRSLYTPLFGGVFWDIQNTLMTDIDRIEVIRGPGATLWGGNAVNGVINILTKNARDTQGGLIVAGGGGQERGFADVRYGGTFGRTAYRIYGTFFDRDSLAQANGADAKDPYGFGQGGFRTDTNISDRDQFTFQGDLYEGKNGILNRPDISLHGGNLLARWTHKYQNHSELQFQAYYDRTSRLVPVQFDETRDTYDADLQYHFQAGSRNDIVVGGGYRFSNDATKPQPVFSFIPSGRHLALANIFAQDEIALLPVLHLTLGSKFEHNVFTGWEIEPTVRLAWAVDTHQTLWGAISRATRIPTQFDEDLRVTFGGPNLLIRGDSAFQSEDLIANEIGYRYWATPRFAIGVSTYYNNYTHLRSQEAPFPGATTVLRNNLEGHTYGAEIGAVFQVSRWWRVNASYSNLQKRLHTTPGSTDLTQGLQEGIDPRNQFSFRSFMDLPHKTELDFWVRHASNLELNGVPPVPSYVVFDVRAGWNPTSSVQFSLVARNLPERRHAEFGPNGELVRRSAYAMVTWRF